MHRIALSFCLFLLGAGVAGAEPPFEGTFEISTELLTSEDPSSFQAQTYVGIETREFWDAFHWTEIEAYIFNVQYPGRQVEFQVHSGFGSLDEAEKWAMFYAEEVGRLPVFMLRRISEVEIQPCYSYFMANRWKHVLHVNPRLLEHLEAIKQDLLGEILLHEGGHMLDLEIVNDPEWLAAQQADNEWISVYARNNSQWEDVADSALAWFAIRHRAGRLSPDVRRKIRQAIPNRLAYFDRFCQREGC